MITLNNATEARELCERFGGFLDAVLVDVHLSLPRTSGTRFGLVTLLVEVPGTGRDSGWKTLVLRIDGLDGYRLTEGPETYLVLSDGLRIDGIDEGRCVVVLSPGEVERAAVGVRWSQYVSGRTCSYRVVDSIA